MEENEATGEHTVRVFNKALQESFWFVEDGEWKLPPGRWTHVPRKLAVEYLWKEKTLIVDWASDKPAITTGPVASLPDLLFASPLDCITGYGSAAVALVPQLQQLFGLHLYPLGSWAAGDWRREVIPEATANLMDMADGTACEWAIALTIPPELPCVPGKNIILLSMWETNQLPTGWAAITNQYAKHLVVPCESQAEVWERSGVTIPISIVPLGADTDLYQYRERPVRDEDHPFTILLYGLLSSRKSPIETLSHVCWRALAEEEDWQLVFKTFGGQLGGGQFTPIIEDPRVRIINAQYRPQEMADLCHDADVGIFLSKFEGFGLPPREMMASGLPLIWSVHSGHLEDCGKGVTIDIPITRIIPAEGPYKGLGGWGEPDWKAAADALRQEYDDWHERGRTQSPLGTKAAEYIRQHRTWAHTAHALKEVVYGMA